MKTEKTTIGIILKAYPRLSETFIINEILRLEELGFKFHIFALRKPAEAVIHEMVQRVRAKVTYIPDYFWRSSVSLLSANVRLYLRNRLVYRQAFRFALQNSLKERNSSTIKRFVQAAYLVQNRLSQVRVAHLHAHFSHDPTTVAFFASLLSGITYSFSAHAKDIYLQDTAFLHLKSTGARFVVTCTEHNRQYLQRISGNGVPIFRSYHGVNLEFFSPPLNCRSCSVPLILSIGRLVPKKGFSVLIEALSLLARQGYRFQCKIIGSGPMETTLRRQISNLELDDCVELIPPMSHRQLRDHCHQANVFALACEVQSDGDRDGIPNVVVEAMATALPVVSTRISGIPECVEHGVTGFLVPEQDPGAFADAMAELLRDPELAHRFGQAGRSKVEKHFDVSKNVSQIGVLLRQVRDFAVTFPYSRPFPRPGKHLTTEESKHADHVISD